VKWMVKLPNNIKLPKIKGGQIPAKEIMIIGGLSAIIYLGYKFFTRADASISSFGGGGGGGSSAGSGDPSIHDARGLPLDTPPQPSPIDGEQKPFITTGSETQTARETTTLTTISGLPRETQTLRAGPDIRLNYDPNRSVTTASRATRYGPANAPLTNNTGFRPDPNRFSASKSVNPRIGQAVNVLRKYVAATPNSNNNSYHNRFSSAYQNKNTRNPTTQARQISRATNTTRQQTTRPSIQSAKSNSILRRYQNYKQTTQATASTADRKKEAEKKAVEKYTRLRGKRRRR